jgi:UDP-N-acetylglucosamine acyltransferase
LGLKRLGCCSGAIVGADIPGRTIIGENNVIGHYAVVGAKCQDLKYKVYFF